MSQINELLQKKVELEKVAFASYVKGLTTSTITTLVNQGLPFEKAASYAKEVCNTNTVITARSNEINFIEKLASYVSALEQNVEELEKTANEVKAIPEPRGEPGLVEKLASMGFTKEDLDSMSPDLVEKVASVTATPWTMGAGTGAAREKTDAMLEFLLG